MELVEKDGFISGVAKGERDRRRNWGEGWWNSRDLGCSCHQTNENYTRPYRL